MHTLSVVKKLDVFKQADPQLLRISVISAVNPFGFQRFEKRFRHRVIVAISLAAHALTHSVFFQQIPEAFAGVLNPSI